MIEYDLPDELYHRRPELSSTGARSLLPAFKGSPAKYMWDRTHPPMGKRSYDFGHAIHERVLGVGSEVVEYPLEHQTPSGNPSTKKATVEWEEEQRKNGLVPLAPADARKIKGVIEAVLANPDARKILELPHRETSIFNTSPEGVPVRARFDIYGDTAAADLKTTTDASPRGFSRHVVEYGYFVQEAWYRDVHKFETGEDLDSFKFLAVETSGPYQVAVHELDVIYRDIGTKLAREARDVWQRCMDTGEWPGIEGELLAPPNWLVYEHEDEMEFTFGHQ